MNSSKSLFTLTACALVAAAVPAFALNSATTEYNGTTYSGDIYKITSTGFGTLAASHNTLTPFATDDASKYVLNSDTQVWEWQSGFGGSASYSSSSNSTAWLASPDGNAAGNTLLLNAATSSGASCSYTLDWQNYVWIGGLITEGDGSYTIGRNGNQNIKLAGTSNVNMSIGANTTIQATGTAEGYSTIFVESSGSWVVAEGKTLTLTASRGVSFADDVSVTVSGGGTVTMGDVVVAKASGGAGTITFDGSTTGGTITLAQGESYSDYESVFTVGEDTKLTYSSLKANGVGNGFTGTVELKNISTSTDLTTLSNYWTSGSTLILNGVSSAHLSSATLNVDFVVGENGLTINNGSSSTASSAGIFSGKITGAGTITFDKWTSGSGETQVQASQTGGYKFTGDMTGFSGNISYGQATALQFGADTAAAYASTATAEGGVIKNIAGTGAISVSTAAALTFSYTGGANGETLSLDNESISASTSTVTFTGGADYLVNAKLSASALTISAGTTTLAGETNTVTGAITVSENASLGLAVKNVSAGSVTFAEGAKLVLDDALLASVDADSAVEFTLNLITSDSITFGETLLTSENVSTFFADDTWVTFVGDAFAGYDKSFSYDNNTLTLTLTAIPEPSAFGLLAGLGALALVASRRRRNKR